MVHCVMQQTDEQNHVFLVAVLNILGERDSTVDLCMTPACNLIRCCSMVGAILGHTGLIYFHTPYYNTATMYTTMSYNGSRISSFTAVVYIFTLCVGLELHHCIYPGMS